MLGFHSRTLENLADVERARERAAYRNFRHAAASIRKDAAASIKEVRDKTSEKLGFAKNTNENASAPGTPPHTRRGKRLKKAIFFWADRYGAEIGPRASFVGKAGSAHEKGGLYKGQRFPQRAFMVPALRRGIPRFAGSWRGSLYR